MQIIALVIFVLIFAVVYVAVHLLIKRQHWFLKGLISFFGTIAILGLTIYGFSPKKIVYSDPELTPLWKAVEEVKRGELGFTAVSKDSKIGIERAKGRAYDVMLHIYHHTSRTIAFKKKGNGFIWIGEQETFKGPNKYETPDGLVNECVVLTYDKEKMGLLPTEWVKLIKEYGNNPFIAVYS